MQCVCFKKFVAVAEYDLGKGSKKREKYGLLPYPPRTPRPPGYGKRPYFFPLFFYPFPYQQVPPHIAVTEVAMPVDCWGKLLHPLDLPQQLSHLDFPVTSYSYLDYPVTSAFLSFRFSICCGSSLI